MAVILALPFLVVLVAFTLSNTQPTDVGLWPFDYRVEVPLSIAVLVGMAAAFLLGGLFVWGSAVAQRLRAARAESDVRMLREQVAALKDRLAQPPEPRYAAALAPPA